MLAQPPLRAILTAKKKSGKWQRRRQGIVKEKPTHQAKHTSKMEPEERQVMPGVTLTDFRKQPSTGGAASQTTVAGDQVEVVQAQINELRNQIKHLVRSNAELEEALAEEYDKDFADAVEGALLSSSKLGILCSFKHSVSSYRLCTENKGVILKREIQIKELQDLLPKHAAEPENHEDGLYI
jgi:hypothetical protein